MTTPRYEAVPSRVWTHADGRRASIYGAHPGPGFVMEAAGYTVRDTHTGTVGVYGSPFATPAEAQARADRLNAL